MKMTKEALKVRSTIKKRKPTYKRVQSHQFAKLKDTKWRKPKGMGNKVRRNRRGKPSMPQVGFGSPKLVRGLNKEGLREVIISNTSELAGVNVKEEIVVISKTVGGRKKLEILTEAKKLKLNISNVKDIESTVKSLTKVKKAKETKTKEETKAPEKKTEAKAEAKK